MKYVIEGKPLSVNNAKAAVNVRGKLRMISTSKARKWKDTAVWSLKAQNGTTPRIEGPCSLSISVFLPTAAGDVDNYVKSAMDALQSAGIILNDRQVQRISVTKAQDKYRPRVEITVEIDREP